MTFNTEKHIQDILFEESNILKEFTEFKSINNPMKVKKLALRMLRERDELTDLQRRLVTDVAIAKNASKTVKDFIARINDCAVIVRHFVETGCHGMIMVGSNCYPIKLKTVESWLDPTKPWNEEDERQICVDACRNLMCEEEIVYLHGKALLFPHFGFSGIPREMELHNAKMDSSVKLRLNTLEEMGLLK